MSSAGQFYVSLMASNFVCRTALIAYPEKWASSCYKPQGLTLQISHNDLCHLLPLL